MSKQLLFYELVTPISKARHARWSVRTDGQYMFAADTNAVPLMTVEFLAAAHEFPIVFSVDNDSNVIPVAVMGLDVDKSLFVASDGSWGSNYIPAFVRRYPFVFSASEDGATLTLCIDEAYEGFDRKGKNGQRLFDNDGERTPYLESMLQFANAYQGEHQRTRLFGEILKTLDVLEPSEAKITLPDGTSRSLTGFQCISREKLKALKGDKLAELLANDALELIYLHLYSMRNFDDLVRKLTIAAAA
jgi:SapC